MTPVAEPAITVFPTQANFIAFRTRATLDDFLERGVLIRKTALPDVLRVSIGTREQNDRFLQALKEIVSTGGDRSPRHPERERRISECDDSPLVARAAPPRSFAVSAAQDDGGTASGESRLAGRTES